MRKLLAVVAGVLVLAVIALVAADGPLRGEVQRRVAADLQASVPFTDTPTVELGGALFAWHALTRRFPSAHVRAAGMPMRMAEQQVTLTGVDVSLSDVDATAERVRARSLQGKAVLTYADLSKLAGIGVSGADGRLAATYSTDLFSLPVRVVVSGEPSLDKATQSVTITAPDLTVAGHSVGPDVSKALLDALLKPVPVPLDYGLTLSGIAAGADGLHVAFEGTDVAFG